MELATDAFFPTPVTYGEPPLSGEEAEVTGTENAPFVIGELVTALEAAKMHTAPYAEHITLTMLRNLHGRQSRAAR